MENFFLQAVVDRLAPELSGASLGRVWQPSEATLCLDFRRSDGRFLFVSAEPQNPGLYLTGRPIAELERASGGERAFASLLRKRLRGATVVAVTKPADDRVVTIEFRAFDAAGSRERLNLIAELTGRSANVYLVDEASTLLGALRSRPDEIALPRRYDAPRRGAGGAGLGPTLTKEVEARAATLGHDEAAASVASDLSRPVDEARVYVRTSAKGTVAYTLATFPLASREGDPVETFSDPSIAADEAARRAVERAAIEDARRGVLARVRAAVASRERLAAALAEDLAATEGAERYRELAESLLAQVTTARAVDGGLEFDDLYAPDTPKVRVDADRGETPQAVAERLFARHRKARRTRESVGARAKEVEESRAALASLVARLERSNAPAEIVAMSDELDGLLGVRRVKRDASARPAKTSTISGARRFVSSDGYEILVGRSSAANDALTFKVARPSDLWLHAADYPGSHVVVRNPGRGDVPHRTIVEAAQLAAFYSDAQGEALADVRYTPRRFVTKPRGAALGLVRVARFRTVAVRPSADFDRAS